MTEIAHLNRAHRSAFRKLSKLALGAAAILCLAGAGAPPADAATTCTFADSLLEMHMTADGDSANLTRSANTEIAVSGKAGRVACTGAVPTTGNTDTVLIVDDSDNLATAAGNDGRTRLSITEPADFAPGRTSEPTGLSEIEFLVDPNGGRDQLIAGGQRAQLITVGNGGVSWNSDEEADMLAMPFESVWLEGGSAADLLSGHGGHGTGAPLSTAEAFALIGGRGSGNFLIGSDIPSGDTISGSEGGDLIRGGAGDDSISADFGDDFVDGGAGADTIHFYETDPLPADARGLTVDLGKTGAQDTGEGRDTLGQIENVVGSVYADRLTGNPSENLLDGDGGDDTLDGRAGDDDLRGGAGADAVSYAEAPAAVTVDLARTTQPGAGEDRLNSIEDVIGSPFADTLSGNLVANRVVGGAGADTIAAAEGADRVEVRDGEGDRVSCGADADTAISDRRSLDALEADCETVDALPEPVQSDDGPNTPDTALSFSLRGASSQRLLRQRAVHVTVRCPLEACTAVASGGGRLRATTSSGLRATRLRLGPLTAGVAAGTARTLKLRLTRRQLSALRKALGAGQRPKLKITVRARDAAGNTVARTLTVTARR